MSNQEYIKIEGAYENNLKHISLDIPKKQITIGDFYKLNP